MQDILEEIEAFSEDELMELMRAIEKRYATVHPGWDVVYIALPKDAELRYRQVERILRFMQKHPGAEKSKPIPFLCRE